jgi:hypothetical protein
MKACVNIHCSHSVTGLHNSVFITLRSVRLSENLTPGNNRGQYKSKVVNCGHRGLGLGDCADRRVDGKINAMGPFAVVTNIRTRVMRSRLVMAEKIIVGLKQAVTLVAVFRLL